MQELTNEILKGRIEKTVSRILAQFEELATRRLERVSQKHEFDFASELRWLLDDWRLSYGRLSGVRRLFEIFTDDFSIEVSDYVDSASDRLQGLFDSASDKLLELSRSALARSVEEPIFAPTTQPVETVLLPPVFEDVTPKQDGESNPACSVVSLQSLGASVTGFVADCPHCLNEYWRTMSAPDAAFCPMCGFSGLSGSECVYEAA